MSDQKRKGIDNREFEKMMASHLPPRSEIHNKKKRKNNRLSQRGSRANKGSGRRVHSENPQAKIEKSQELEMQASHKEHTELEKVGSRQKKEEQENKRSRYPLIKFLAFIFILIPIIIAVIYFYEELEPEKAPVYIEKDSFEHVEFENK